MSKYAPHGYSSNQPRATAATVCQKCLGQGHFTYQCKNTRPYVSRPSRTKQLEKPAVLEKLRAGARPSVDVPEEFKTKCECRAEDSRATTDLFAGRARPTGYWKQRNASGRRKRRRKTVQRKRKLGGRLMVPLFAGSPCSCGFYSGLRPDHPRAARQILVLTLNRSRGQIRARIQTRVPTVPLGRVRGHAHWIAADGFLPTDKSMSTHASAMQAPLVGAVLVPDVDNNLLSDPIMVFCELF
jgi:hypothetical protein